MGGLVVLKLFCIWKSPAEAGTSFFSYLTCIKIFQLQSFPGFSFVYTCSKVLVKYMYFHPPKYWHWYANKNKYKQFIYKFIRPFVNTSVCFHPKSFTPLLHTFPTTIILFHKDRVSVLNSIVSNIFQFKLQREFLIQCLK